MASGAARSMTLAMLVSRSSRNAPPGPPLAVLGYAAAWFASAAAITVLVVLLLGGSGPEEVSLPPVQQTQLAAAARAARCTLVHAAPGERLNPAVDGPADAPAAPGVYKRPPPTAALVGAVRHGIVVIQVGSGVPDEAKDVLTDLQRAAPAGTIIMPAAPGMPFALAVTAYRRLLGCHAYTSGSLDAVRLFQGRFVGTGPGR